MSTSISVRFAILTGISILAHGPSAQAADAPDPKPATLAKVRQSIDWFKFPKPDGAQWEDTNLVSTHYWVPGKIDDAVDYYRKTMAALGWVEEKRPFPEPNPDKNRSLEFTKAGFVVTQFLTAKPQTIEIGLRNCGNVDARKLPKPADAKEAGADRKFVMYTTASKPDAVVDLCRKEMAARGWRETPTPGAAGYAREGKSVLRFVQNAMQCEVHVGRNKDGATEVYYHTAVRDKFEPADVAANFAPGEVRKPATAKEALEVLDLRKLPRIGETPAKVNTGLRLEYVTPTPVYRAVAFYRKALTDQGWALGPSLTNVSDHAKLSFEKAGFLLRLEVREEDNPAFVSIALSNHGNVDLRQFPYPPGAEIGYLRENNPRITTSANGEEIGAFYRKELTRLGWKERGKNLEFLQNDSRVKLYVHNTRDGQTPIQVSVQGPTGK